jgi:hypothetical protein
MKPITRRVIAAITRRVVAAIVAMLTIVVLLVWTLIANDAITDYAIMHLARNVPLSQASGPRPDAYDRAAHLYYELLIGALLIASGSVVALLILLPSRSFRQRAWLYLGSLLLLLPFSFYNFSQGGIVLAPAYQFGVNFVIVFLGATTAVWIANAPAVEIDERVLKIMCVFLLALVVCVVSFFNILWLLQKVQILTIDQTKHVTWAHLTSAASVVSAIVAWLNYRRELRKQADASLPQSRRTLILPGGD